MGMLLEEPPKTTAEPIVNCNCFCTTTEKLWVALCWGVPLSATLIVMRLLVFACASVGVHWKAPVLASIVAPVGAPGRRE